MPIRLNTTRLEAEHLTRIEKYARQVERIYLQAVDEFVRLASELPFDQGRLFSFDQFPHTKARVRGMMSKIVGQTMLVVRHGIFKEWEASNDKNDNLIDQLFHRVTNKKGKQYLRLKQRNNDALDAFRQRKYKGLGLSQRIWKNTEQFKKELELALDLGVGEGMAANKLARRVKQYLNDPDKAFRKITDKHGKKVLSQAAEAYNPGQGRYRSSIKNARRLTRTETNMSYRTADHLRVQQLPFVTGIEVKVSNANKTCPVCKRLAGKYPKTFKFVGWHPQCMCYTISVMNSEKEFEEMERAIMEDRPPSEQSVNTVKDIPLETKQWWQENEKRINKHSSLPYFITDNEEYFSK